MLTIFKITEGVVDKLFLIPNNNLKLTNIFNPTTSGKLLSEKKV